MKGTQLFNQYKVSHYGSESLTKTTVVKQQSAFYPLPPEHIGFELHQKKYACTALSVTNAADLYWISVDCSALLAKDVVCQLKKHRRAASHLSVPNSTFCFGHFVSTGDWCYSFEWKGVPAQNYCLNVYHSFEYLFQAFSGNSFPPIFVSHNKMITVTRYIDKITYREYLLRNLSIKAFCIQGQPKIPIVIGGNLFMCADGTIISALCICDNVFDCPGDLQDDERNCECNRTQGFQTTGNICNFWVRRDEGVCSNLQKHSEGSCETNDKTSNAPLSSAEKMQSFVECRNGEVIDKFAIDDLVVDCLEYGEDEPILLQ